MKQRTRRTFGFAVVALVLVIAFMFVMMSLGAGDSVTLGLRNMNRLTLERRTNYGAYGALQLALDELNKNYTYSCDIHSVPCPADADMVYDLRICNNYNEDLAPNPPAGVADAVPRKMVYIEAKCDLRGYVGKYTTKVYSKAALGDYSTAGTIVGTDQVTITNSTVDGFTLNGLALGGAGLKPWAAGKIVTNSIQPGGMTLTGPQTKIKANLGWGPKGAASVISDPGPPAVEIPATCTKSMQDPVAYRVPRFRPPHDPSDALGSAGVNKNVVANEDITGANFKSINVTGATLSLHGTDFFVAGNLTVSNGALSFPDATGDHPCDIYVGGNVTITNSQVNWANRLGSADPAAYPASADGPTAEVIPPLDLEKQAVKGPRTVRIFFVGSGAPRFKDSTFTAVNSKISLVAAGKAMKVELSNTEAWGGFKGARFLAINSYLHYHRYYEPPPPP